MISTAQPTSPSPQHCLSLCNTGSPQNGANDSYNHILDDFVNSLVEESNNKDGKNIMDKGKAKNYSDNTDNNNAGDGDHSNNNSNNTTPISS